MCLVNARSREQPAPAPARRNKNVSDTTFPLHGLRKRNLSPSSRPLSSEGHTTRVLLEQLTTRKVIADLNIPRGEYTPRCQLSRDGCGITIRYAIRRGEDTSPGRRASGASIG